MAASSQLCRAHPHGHILLAARGNCRATPKEGKHQCTKVPALHQSFPPDKEQLPCLHPVVAAVRCQDSCFWVALIHGSGALRSSKVLLPQMLFFQPPKERSFNGHLARPKVNNFSEHMKGMMLRALFKKLLISTRINLPKHVCLTMQDCNINGTSHLYFLNINQRSAT